MTRVGVISDTHGELPDRVLELFGGTDHVIHAGDVGADDVLLALEALAAVTAVRGNMDHAGMAVRLPRVARTAIGGVLFVVTHRDLGGVPPDIRPGGSPVCLVSGHTHRPMVRQEGDVLRLNPGSASRGMGDQGDTVALVDIEGGRPRARIVAL